MFIAIFRITQILRFLLPVDRLRSGAFGILLESTLSGSAAISFPLIAVGGEHPGFRRAREIASEHLRHDLELLIAGEQRSRELDRRSTASPGATAIRSRLILARGSRSAATPVTIAVSRGRSRSGSVSFSPMGLHHRLRAGKKPQSGKGCPVLCLRRNCRPAANAGATKRRSAI